ncbi:MAG: arylsulfatase [Luminiphilus sp.]|nr:arylsulfatase [Luminiphilus sp.]
MQKAILKFLAVFPLLAVSSAVVLATEDMTSAVLSSLALDDSRRPNIVLILADDLGFTDLASYGSEIQTPSLDALAAQGVRFSNYHSAANCAPARAMLLTGVDSHLAGVPNIPELLAPEQRAAATHYRGVLGHNVVTVATLLEGAGYRTYMAGKWHLGMAPEQRPIARGFQRTVAMMDSGADNWEQRPYLPLYDRANWFADGERFNLPEDFYSSEFLVDKMMAFIDADARQGAPFFAYLPFMAVHMPVQAPQEFIDHYEGAYLQGWDRLRKQRRERAAALGIIPDDVAMVRMATTDDWDALSPDDKAYQAKRMAVYAGMVEAMDAHIGRLIEFLKARGDYDNTLFIFTSDNGSEASGPADPRGFVAGIGTRRMGYSVAMDGLGLKGSFGTISPSFASASASPLAFYKFYAGEGGMRVPLIIAGAGVAAKDTITPAFAWVTDIAPTILSYAGVSAPASRYAGREVEPITGRSLRPLAASEVGSVYGANDAVGYELTGHGVLFQGDYKLVVNQGPLGDGQWRLFNIAEDPGEMIDLAATEPQQFQTMLNGYQSYILQNKVMPLPAGYTQMGQLLRNVVRKELGDMPLVLLFTALLLLPFAVIYKLNRKGSL